MQLKCWLNAALHIALICSLHCRSFHCPLSATFISTQSSLPAKPPLRTASGCLSLTIGDGTLFKFKSEWRVCRFVVKTYVAVEAPPKAPTGMSSNAFSKLLYPKAPPRKSLSKTFRKLSKQRSSKSTPVSSLSAKQLGIKAYFASQDDGPIGAMDDGRSGM